MADVKLKQIRSSARATAKQRGALDSLKLGRIDRESTMKDTPQLRGALVKVGHLVEIDGVATARGVAHERKEAG
jgi:large subunit ribosomal protein L30